VPLRGLQERREGIPQFAEREGSMSSKQPNPWITILAIIAILVVIAVGIAHNK